MRWARRFLQKVVIVLNFEGMVVALLARDLGRFIHRDERHLVMSRSPGELLDPGRRFRDLPGVAAGHWHDENLSLAVGRSEKCEARAIGRPAGLSQSSAISSQH